MATGKRCPFAKAGVGVIATQAVVNVYYGEVGLKLLELGFEPEAALETMLKGDINAKSRQVSIISGKGKITAFTGENAVPWKGHIIGRDYVVAGNTLTGEEVVRAMAGEFERSSGELAERLLAAMQAGQDAGGDRLGKRSSALVVVKEDQFVPWGPHIDLRVDYHNEPVRELRHVYDEYIAWVNGWPPSGDRSAYLRDQESS